ncbi:hypothetical protein EON81_17940 [bacterium]|nr:MAG: hypothetical protein EON81_17940 [bacterium]
MATQDVWRLVRECTRFLGGHGGPRTLQDQLREVTDSPLSLVKNDHYGRGGVVTDLEGEVAALLGKEAAVFMPSGTMAQPITLRIWSDRAGIPTVAFHPTCHLHLHEQMAYRELHHLGAVLVGEGERLFTLEDLKAVEEPVSTLLIELPQREIGGQLPTWEELVKICDEARARGMRIHMDGARLWECAPYYGRSYAEISALFDSVYVSFYKILNALPGAILAGPQSLIDEARIWQRRQGGNLYQQATNAISAKLAMERHLPRMADYVAKAGEIAEVLQPSAGVRVVPERPPTNMMHLHFRGDPERLNAAFLQIAEEDKVGLFFGLPEDGKIELAVGESALGLNRDEIGRLFEKLFALAA